VDCEERNPDDQEGLVCLRRIDCQMILTSRSEVCRIQFVALFVKMWSDMKHLDEKTILSKTVGKRTIRNNWFLVIIHRLVYN
jgi:hypothetical protein